MARAKKNAAAPTLNPESVARLDITHQYAPNASPQRPEAGTDCDREDIVHAVNPSCAANRSGEIFNDPAGEPLRLGGAGIGWKPPALIGGNMWKPEEWYGRPGNHSHDLQLFSWNAGNSQRSAKRGTRAERFTCFTISYFMCSGSTAHQHPTFFV